MDDFDYQLGYVAQNAWRLLSLQDGNRLSPKFGCFHYAYWRDKTSEFPDARFQEAGAALGLLSLPCFDPLRAQGLPAPEALRTAFSAGLLNLSRQQREDGSLDEWYKGERGFAACEFPAVAYGLAGHFLKQSLDAADRSLLEAVLTKAGDWLLTRHDFVKSNHEAAAAAALALAWDVTGQERFRSGAREKLLETLRRQTAEGWFPEIGGMDLGYCSVLLDYVMLYVFITGEQTPAVPAMRRLTAFMLPHLQPGPTISPEAGLCLNPYVSRLGFGLLSAFDETARAAVNAFSGHNVGKDGLLPYLSDDLRLARWAYLPVTTSLLREHFKAGPEQFDDLLPKGWTVSECCAVAAYHDERWHVHFSPAGGGVVRVFLGDKLLLEDLGVDLLLGETVLTCSGYDSKRGAVRQGNAVVTRAELGQPAFFSPGFVSRLLLRLACSTATTSRLARAFIDWRRLRSGTAVNQSSAPLAKSAGGASVRRLVKVDATGVTVRDELVLQAPAPRQALRQRLGAGAESMGSMAPIDGQEGMSRVWVLEKTIPCEGAPTLQIFPQD